MRAAALGWIIAAALALSAPTGAHAQYVLQPNELDPSGSPGDSKDAKVYENIPGPLTSNLDAYNPSSGANFISYIAFDLSSIPLAGAHVTSSTLELYARQAAGIANGMASIAGPVVVELRLVTSPWSETAIDYFAQPSVGALVASQIVNAGGQFYSFDVTSAVQGWLNNPTSNNGLQITVATPGGEAFFFASGGTNANAHPDSQDPRLTVVPEPSATVALVLGGVALATLVCPRRRAARQIA